MSCKVESSQITQKRWSQWGSELQYLSGRSLKWHDAHLSHGHATATAWGRESCADLCCLVWSTRMLYMLDEQLSKTSGWVRLKELFFFFFLLYYNTLRTRSKLRLSDTILKSMQLRQNSRWYGLRKINNNVLLPFQIRER